MNKKILAIFLAITMLLGLIPASVAYAAEPTIVFTVTPDVTEAHPGDTVTYTISLKTSENVSGTQFYLNIPTGMTYVASSGKIDPNLKATLNNDANEIGEVSYTESLKMFIANTGALEGLNNLSGGVTFGTFQCTVDASASGNIDVGLTIDVLDDGDVNPYPTTAYTVQTTPVNVTPAPKPATGITLNKSTTTIYTGSDETLVATVEPADTTDTVTWESDNTAVATVDTNGKVTAVAPGTANITAKAGSQSASCVVTVENAPCTHTNKTNVGAKSSTCKEQGWEAYSTCDDCGQLFDEEGNKISAIPYLSLADHTPAQTAAIEYLKDEATCTSPAVYYEHCSVCDVKLNTTFTSGGTEPHTESGWKSDADGHWKECTVCGTITTAKVVHTPDHEGHATEEYAIKCTECYWVIEAQLAHTHTMTPVAAKDPTCTVAGNSAYYVCSGCGKWFEDETGSVEITDHSSVVIGAQGHDWADATCTAPKTCERCGTTEGEALGHDYATTWSSNADKHWHECSRCGDKADEVAHTPDREAATETDPVKCSVCGYEIAPALGMQDYILEMPVSIAVKLTGDEKPAKETFKFEIYDLGCEDAEFEIVNDSVVVENLEFDENGVAFVGGIIKIKVTGEDQLCNLTEGFKVRMVKGSTKGWTYASEQWYIELFFENDALDFGIAVKEIVDGEISEAYANGMSFAVSYEAVTDPNPADPQSPETGDNGMTGLWLALLLVSGAGAAATTIYSRKRKYSAK